jgi:predicted metal-binding membrane protein
VTNDRALLGVAALVFLASAAVTALWCGSMSAMPGMAMPGGWTMSMAWMRMPGQGWLGYTGMFVGMWAVMMPAMMLPALMPMLAQYRRALGVERQAALTATVAAAYFAVWILSGVALFAPGVALAEWAMREPEVSRLAPPAGALMVLIAGALQFSPWKARQLACCRHTVDCCRGLQPDHRTAWRHGMKLGLRCVYCCAGLTAVLLVMGVMDLRAMALVTMAISAERLMPASSLAARAVGAVLLIVGAGMLVTVIAG